MAPRPGAVHAESRARRLWRAAAGVVERAQFGVVATGLRHRRVFVDGDARPRPPQFHACAASAIQGCGRADADRRRRVAAAQ